MPLRAAAPSAASNRQLALDEPHQGAKGGKGRTIDVVVFNREAEPFLKARQHRHRGHGIELGQRADQRRIRAKLDGTALQTQYLVEQCGDLTLHIQFLLPDWSEALGGNENSPSALDMGRDYSLSLAHAPSKE